MAVAHSVLRIPIVPKAGVVLGQRGCGSLGTRHGPFLLFVANGSQWKGGKGRTYCAGGLPESLISPRGPDIELYLG